MINTVFLEVYTKSSEFNDTNKLKIPLETLITYYIYKNCVSEAVSLRLVYRNKDEDPQLTLFIQDGNLTYVEFNELPWQVSSCAFPVVMYDDTIITGLCAVVRHICKFNTNPICSAVHEEGLLGFRKSCLQAPKETSIWTKFCEIDLIATVKAVLQNEEINTVPIDLVRFENHLNKPVKVHNVYKIARDMKKKNKKLTDVNPCEESKNTNMNQRVPKSRKWKSNLKKDLQIDCCTKIGDLDLIHQFAEGPFLTLADLIIYPCYYIISKRLGNDIFKSVLPTTNIWFSSLQALEEIKFDVLQGLSIDTNTKVSNMELPITDDVSLYKCDPKRHNPKKRLFTKEEDIDTALVHLTDGMEIPLCENNESNRIKWESIPDGANPNAGHLPDDRMVRKSQQLENLTSAVLSIAKENDLIVDFCSGSGHLGILIAYLLPKCTVILLENKEQSLFRARKRVHEMNLKNIYLFQCNLDFFIGKFDIGIALHACGVASDLVLDKCIKANAKFVLCPCCYGSLHTTDKLVYPRSVRFSNIATEKYLCIGHAADQTHEDHPLTARGSRCMAVIDSDRGRLAEQFGYKVTLSRLKPLSCTPKNNLLIGVPS